MYNRLPEDEPLGLIHVEDIVKIKILRLTKVPFVGLYYMVAVPLAIFYCHALLWCHDCGNWPHFHHAAMLMASHYTPYVLVFLEHFSGWLYRLYVADFFLRAAASCPWPVVRVTIVFIADFLSIQKKLMFARCPDWDSVTSNGNILPLHGQLQLTNMFQHIQMYFTPIAVIGIVVILTQPNCRNFRFSHTESTLALNF